MTPRDLLAKLVTNPDDDCIFVLKPAEGLRVWVPEAVARSIGQGNLPIHVIRTLVAQYYLGKSYERLAHLVELSARTVTRLVNPARDEEVHPVRKSIMLKTSFGRMVKKLQVNTRTDALVVLKRDDNHIYVPDEVMPSLDRGEADLHFVTATALSELLGNPVKYYPYWREALEDVVPGFVTASGLEAAMQQARRETSMGG